MAISLYKPNQGYWVRVLTATMIGVLALATAAWLAGQMGVVAENLPKHTWQLSVAAPQGTAAPGQSVEVLGSTGTGGASVVRTLGTASVLSYDQTGTIRLGDFKLEGEALPSNIKRVRSTDGSFSADLSNAMAEFPVQPMLLKGGVGAIVIVLGALVAFYFAGTKQGTCEFLIATDVEMKKVNWSTRKHITDSTFVVIFAAVLIAAVLFIVDQMFSKFFQAIGVLVK
jgi:preprotein translocase SecE subunit